MVSGLYFLFDLQVSERKKNEGTELRCCSANSQGCHAEGSRFDSTVLKPVWIVSVNNPPHCYVDTFSLLFVLFFFIWKVLVSNETNLCMSADPPFSKSLKFEKETVLTYSKEEYFTLTSASTVKPKYFKTIQRCHLDLVSFSIYLIC